MLTGAFSYPQAIPSSSHHPSLILSSSFGLPSVFLRFSFGLPSVFLRFSIGSSPLYLRSSFGSSSLSLPVSSAHPSVGATVRGDSSPRPSKIPPIYNINMVEIPICGAIDTFLHFFRKKRYEMFASTDICHTFATANEERGRPTGRPSELRSVKRTLFERFS